MTKAFTMLELIFAIVIIGILSAVAIPKLAATRDDAIISKARNDVAAMRSAIATERQKRILRGDFSDINVGDIPDLLDYGLDSKWSVGSGTITFTAPNGSTCSFKIQNNKLVRDSCGITEMNSL